MWRNGDDKIVDIAAGKNCWVIITEGGKVYNQGFVSYREISSEDRYNSENYEDYPHEIYLPPGSTNPRVWIAQKQYIWYITVDIENRSETWAYGAASTAKGTTNHNNYEK